MRKLFLVGLLASLAGCEAYTDQTSPCVGQGAASTNKPIPSSSSRAFMANQVSRNAADLDCAYRPIGANQ
jgi:hypothetical protein